MTRRSGTMSAQLFETMYTATPDPWGFRSSAYEQDKYASTLAALARPHYAEALEVGCSIGVFTRSLAPRCDRLLAIDASGTALAAAREACAACPNVTLEQRFVPAGFPPGRFALIVLSEVLYYMTTDDLRAVAEACFAAQPEGGEIVICHWLGETDYPLTGLEATQAFVAAATASGYRHEMLHADVYRLDRLLAGEVEHGPLEGAPARAR